MAVPVVPFTSRAPLRGDVGSAMNADDETTARSNIIHREILQLCGLIVVAVAAFFLTRAVAASNREMNLMDAEEWYRRGQQKIAAGKLDEAVESFRRAAVRNRNDKRYLLALARTLALSHDDDAAGTALLELRESTPEDAEVNLELARLAARHGDVKEALRFYRSALYAPWSTEDSDARRRVRFELVRFLLAHDQPDRALVELLAISTDLPDDAAAHLESAQLFADAGDDTHSLAQFQRTLRLAPDNRTALTGAGLGAFRLGRYSLARGYLHRVPLDGGEVATVRTVVDLVLSNDPLGNRIGSVERRRRLSADATYEQQRFTECLGERASGQVTDDERALQREVEELRRELSKSAKIVEQDTLEAGVDVIDRVALQVSRTCGGVTAFDRALALIARQHGGDAR
jgi:tetratricopeptide (TPR) repeat protein